VTSEQIQQAEKILGHTFKNPLLLRESLTHASSADNRLLSNERMEFLGDAVLDLIICEELYQRFPKYAEGDLTKVKSAVVSRQTCAAIARETSLDRLLILGKGITSRQAIPASISAAVYESIVAALYLDAGFEFVRQYVLKTMGPHIEKIAASIHQHNYKATLQQHAQRELADTPIYELLDEKGPDHSKCFEVCVMLKNKRYPSAWGTNKKVAEQKAALLALEELGVLTYEDVTAGLEQLQTSETSSA
jgi:ribonuclease III